MKSFLDMVLETVELNMEVRISKVATNQINIEVVDWEHPNFFHSSELVDITNLSRFNYTMERMFSLVLCKHKLKLIQQRLSN